MVKTVLTLMTAVLAGWLVVGSTTSASAHYRHSGCCGPIAPTYYSHTVHRVTHITHYRDVSRTRYVYRAHRIVHTTRVQPVVYVHNVLRVHHHTVGIVRPVYEHMTRYLPTHYIYSHRTINTYDCRCKPVCRR